MIMELAILAGMAAFFYRMIQKVLNNTQKYLLEK